MGEEYKEKEISEETRKTIERLGYAVSGDFINESFPPEIKENIKKALTEIGKNLPKMRNDLDELEEDWEKIKEETPQALIDLADYGWYLDYDTATNTPIKLGKKLEEGKIDEVNEILSAEYKNELGHIEKRIIRFNPERTEIIKEAFENHREGRYYSSITLLLTQVDGLCFDEFERFYFRNDQKTRKDNIYKPEVEAKLRKRAGIVTEWFLEVLKGSRGIDDHSSKVKNYPIRLNRHEILHGLDSKYGTKLNSLKIISFLNFINDIVRYNSPVKAPKN